MIFLPNQSGELRDQGPLRGNASQYSTVLGLQQRQRHVRSVLGFEPPASIHQLARQAARLHGRVCARGSHGRAGSGVLLQVQGSPEVHQEHGDRAVPQIPGDTSKTLLRDAVEQADQRHRVPDRRTGAEPATVRIRGPPGTGQLLAVRDFEPYGIYRRWSLHRCLQASDQQGVERIQR